MVNPRHSHVSRPDSKEGFSISYPFLFFNMLIGRGLIGQPGLKNQNRGKKKSKKKRKINSYASDSFCLEKESSVDRMKGLNVLYIIMLIVTTC